MFSMAYMSKRIGALLNRRLDSWRRLDDTGEQREILWDGSTLTCLTCGIMQEHQWRVEDIAATVCPMQEVTRYYSSTRAKDEEGMKF